MHRVKMEDWICRTENIPVLTRDNLEQLQLRRLNELIKKLKARGGIYTALPDGIDELGELSRLPFTTADMLREHPEWFLSISQSGVSRVISESTSGTSGGAKRVFYSEKDLRNTVNFFASGISEMLSPGEKCLIAFPFSGPSGLGDLIAEAVEKLGALPIRQGYGLTYNEFKEVLRRERPETYIGFPVPLLSLIRLYDGDFPIKRALISGDGCPESVRRGLSEVLWLYPHYGCRETALGGAVTCPAFEGMHLRENHIIAEIVDDDGRVLPDGQWGELVITGIGMEAMPLLRYRTGDISCIMPEKCPCGGVTKRLAGLYRREYGAVSAAKLDNALFALPQLIDYSAAYDGRLHISACGSGECSEIREAIRKIYPDIEADISLSAPDSLSAPAYPGKRHIITEQVKL